MTNRYKIVHVNSAKVYGMYETKQAADHALLKMRLRFAKDSKGKDFACAVVHAGAIFRNYKCMGWIWL